MKRLVLFISFLSCLCAFAQEERILVDKLVGIVGDKVILLSDIELQYQQVELEQEVPVNFRCQLLEQMLSQKMMLQQAFRDSIVVSEDEIEGELNRRISYFISMIGSEEKLEEYYEKSIIEIKNEFRRDIEEQLLSGKMQQGIFGNVRVSPSEVKAFFNSIPKDSLPFFNAEVEVGQIVVFPKVDETQRELALNKLEEIRKRILQGEDFYTLALIYSEDPGSVDKGGDLGFVKRGELVTEFEAAAYGLKEGEVSEIVETKFGFHIIELIEKRGNRIRVRHILIKPKTTSYDLSKARETVDSIRNLILADKYSFAKGVELFSEDESTKNTGGMIINPQSGAPQWEISQLEKSVYFAIDDMMPGDISQPVLFQTKDGQQAYRIILLKSESEAHVANLKDDYNKIKAAALAKKEEEYMLEWLNEKIQETYVYVDDSYLDCLNLQRWFKSADVTIEKTYE